MLIERFMWFQTVAVPSSGRRREENLLEQWKRLSPNVGVMNKRAGIDRTKTKYTYIHIYNIHINMIYGVISFKRITHRVIYKSAFLYDTYNSRRRWYFTPEKKNKKLTFFKGGNGRRRLRRRRPELVGQVYYVDGAAG